MSASGWALLINFGIMNACVIGVMLIEILKKLFQGIIPDDYGSITAAVSQASNNAWGYFLAAAIGMVLLLVWKKPKFLKEEIFAKNAPMKADTFVMILCVFISGQTVFQLGVTTMELILNAFGYTVTEGLESLETDPNNFSMVLYAGILAPITEEILFRGLVQRTMQPFGKKFAILISALTFGLFHGNLLQTPYAFAVGLVLGYVAAEYHILWAIALHIINNLLLGDLLYRILSGFPDETVNMIIWGIILLFTVTAVVLMIIKRKEIADYVHREQLVRPYVRCYFTCAGTVILLIVLGLNTLITTCAMITPL